MMKINKRLVIFIIILLLIGIPAVEGTTWYVNPPPGTGPGYHPIQEAINNANPGDIITVAPGWYDERIVINKSLTLLGATTGIPKKDYAIPSGYMYDAITESIISPSDAQDIPVIQIKNAPVTIDGFIVDFIHSTEYPEMYPKTDLIQIYNTSSYNYIDIHIQNNVIGPNTNLQSQNGRQGRSGIVVAGPSSETVYNLIIKNNKIFNATGDGCGIMLLGSTNSTSGLAAKYKGSLIDNNTISGNHRSGIEFSGGVQGSSATAGHFRITNNTISNNGWNTTVDRNNVTFGNGIVMIHVRSEKEFPLMWGSQYVDIDNNQITGNEKNGIYIGPINRNINITNNIITNNGAGTGGYETGDGVLVDLDEIYHSPAYKDYTFLSGIFLKNNEIHNNGAFGLRVNQTPEKGPIDARNNWWGVASGPKNIAANPSGTGNSVSENVRFAPWYTDTDKSGTQSPDSGSGAIITVSTVGRNNFTSIQKAINAAWAGDTVKVFPGTYDERIVINRSITLKGATAGVSKKGYVVPMVPKKYNYDSSTESIISPQDKSTSHVVVITGNNITLDGFIVSSTTAGVFTPYAAIDLIRMDTSPLNNITIQNNVIGPNTNLTVQNGTAGRMGITIAKWSGATDSDTIYNLQIRNNKIFDAKGDGCGILMIGPRNETLYHLRYQFKRAVIDNNEITGNHRSGIDLSGGVQGGPNISDHIRITNNLITNNGWNDTVDKDNIRWGNGMVMLRMTDQSGMTLQWASQYIDVEGNEFSNNEKNGIYIGPLTQNVTFKNNIIQNNGLGTGEYSKWDGIRIDLDETYQVKERERQGLSSPAVFVYNYLNNIVINESTIQNNGNYGLQVIKTPTLGSIDARNNWWGTASGPKASKNPSGTANNVSENAVFSPWYTSSLKTDTSTTIPKPIATFTVNPVEDMAGATFSFDASASESQSSTSIQTYQWNYGDGNTSPASSSPLKSYIYNSSKVYTITLTVKDFQGTTNQTTRQVTVIAKKEEIPLKFNGTSVGTTAEGKQEIIFENSNINGTMTNTTNAVTVVNPGNGWAQMVVKGNTSGTAGATVTVNDISEVVLKSNTTVTQLDTSPTGVGAVSTSLQLSLTNFTSSPLEIKVSEGANATITNAFQLAAGSGNSVDAVAYTMTIQGTSLINSNLSAPVVLNMSVSKAWVDAHGGISAIKAIRYSDDGNTREVLETHYLFTDSTTAMCYFEIISPNGCSIFGIASVVAVPPSSGASTVSASEPSSDGSDGSGRGSTGARSAPEQPAVVAQPVVAPPVVPEKPSEPVQPQHTMGAPIITLEEEGEIPIAGPAEAEIGRMLGNVLAFISENIAAIITGVAAISTGIGLMVWYLRRDRYQF